MAFMMPLVKNDYNIYPSCPSSTRNGMGTPAPQSRGSSLSSSPTAASFISSRSSQSRSSQTPGSSPKSGSQISLHKFHSKLLDKLRKTFRGKDGLSDDGSSTSAGIR